MRIWIFLLSACLWCGEGISLEKYWLIQEDFTKFGKRDLYEAEKGREIQELKQTVWGIEDLENRRSWNSERDARRKDSRSVSSKMRRLP